MLTLVYVLFVYSHKVTYFFMACLVLKACNFCVAGLMISSDGETNFCSLIHGQQCKVWCCMYKETHGSLSRRDCRTRRW
jgi:hypothetical protein